MERCTSIMQLQKGIQGACVGITKAIRQKVCHSVAQRLLDCLERNGQFRSS